MHDWRDKLADIAECEHCDDSGVRLNGLGRCDHQDYAGAARRGMDLIRQTMNWTYCTRCGIPHAGRCKREEGR